MTKGNKEKIACFEKTKDKVKIVKNPSSAASSSKDKYSITEP